MFNLIRKYVGFVLAVAIFCCVSIAVNAASKAGSNSSIYGKVTPTQAYAILQSYESLFAYYVKHHKKGIAAKVKALKLKSFSGKIPEDVFVKVSRLSDSIDKLAGKIRVESVDRITRAKKKAIPAEVFLQVGNNLDTLVEIMNKLEPGKSWGDYYVNRTYKKAKSPNDVYALADLMVRKIKLTSIN